jgi:hypothetical protein
MMTGIICSRRRTMYLPMRHSSRRSADGATVSDRPEPAVIDRGLSS